MSKKTGPTAANTVKKNKSMLFNFEMKNELGDIQKNPAKLADRMKEAPDGYHTWTEGEIAQFLTFHGEGSKPRLACLLILNTGASRQDVARMGWQNVKDGVISYRRGKTGVAADHARPAKRVAAHSGGSNDLCHSRAGVALQANNIRQLVQRSMCVGWPSALFGAWLAQRCRDPLGRSWRQRIRSYEPVGAFHPKRGGHLHQESEPGKASRKRYGESLWDKSGIKLVQPNDKVGRKRLATH